MVADFQDKHFKQIEKELYGVNHVDEPDSNTTYIGEESDDGSWRIGKVIVSGTSTAFTYATVKNNPSYSDYSSAWTDHTSLTYSTYSEAF